MSMWETGKGRSRTERNVCWEQEENSLSYIGNPVYSLVTKSHLDGQFPGCLFGASNDWAGKSRCCGETGSPTDCRIGNTDTCPVMIMTDETDPIMSAIIAEGFWRVVSSNLLGTRCLYHKSDLSMAMSLSGSFGQGINAKSILGHKIVVPNGRARSSCVDLSVWLMYRINRMNALVQWLILSYKGIFYQITCMTEICKCH